MSRRDFMRARMAIAMTQLYPRLIRDAVISNVELTNKLGVSAEATLDLGSGISVERAVLFDAVTQVLSGATGVSVIDTEGETWRVEQVSDGAWPKAALVQDKRRLFLTNFALLSSNVAVRLGVFEQAALRLNLPEAETTKWKRLLEQRRPKGDELTAIQSDLFHTPVAVCGAISDAIPTGGISFTTLAPRSSFYYDRLVGSYAGAQSLQDHIIDVNVPHMSALLHWNGQEGLKLALLEASQPSVPLALASAGLPVDTLVCVFNWLAENGEALSLAAAIELGLTLEPSDAALQVSLRNLIEAFVANKSPAGADQFKLLSHFFIFVYGEMAGRGILADRPPFQRRMAAMAQAALIARGIVIAGKDASDFIDWAYNVRLQAFMLQGFCDMRTEPRWAPEMALPDQIRDELCGRVWTAAYRHADFVKKLGWNTLLLDDVEGSLIRSYAFHHGFLPGPLEGAAPAFMEMPEENVLALRAELTSTVNKASSFANLYKAAMLFRVPPDIADLAATALARADFHLMNDDGNFIAHVLGIAHSAAILKSQKLADALFVLLRVHRRFHAADMTAEAAFRIAMVACGCHSDMKLWCARVGDCLNELAFSTISKEEAQHLHGHLTHLCGMVPELWASCGQAEAAFRAVIGP